MDIEICDRCGSSFPYSSHSVLGKDLPYDLCWQCLTNPQSVHRKGYPNFRYCSAVGILQK
jgi:hypothetical protein